MKFLKLLLLFLIFYSFSTWAQNLSNPETRGVWISGNYLSGGTNAIESMIRNLSNANFNVIYVDVWYQGSTIYPSNVVANAGGPIQNPSFVNTDPLKTTIEIAHKYGMEVIAWFEYGFMVGHSTDSTDIPNILKVHPDWAMLQRDTTKNFFHNMYGYFFAVDPSVTAAANFAVNLYTECAKNYPNIDGIESDIENDTAVSYSDTSRIRFMQETGNPDPLKLSSNNASWISWRRLQITNVIRRIYNGVKEINPQCLVTAAVPPPYMSSYMLESWNVWSKSGYLDMAEPMLYLSVNSFPNQLSLCKNYVPYGFVLSPGIDISSAGSVNNTITEIKDVRNSGIGGHTIWYYGYILSYPNVLNTLKTNIYMSKTSPVFDDLIIDNSSIGQFKTTGNWTNNTGGYKGTFQEASAAYGDTAEYKVRILRSGRYSILGYWGGDSSVNCKTTILNITSKTINKIDTINQSQNLDKWNYINNLFFNSGDTISIKLFGNGNGNLIADAFRLKRGNIFKLLDYAMPDSENILLKFSNLLLNPISNDTKITLSSGENISNFYVDQIDNTILHVTVPAVSSGALFKVNINNLFDILHDTLTTSYNIEYNPDSTDFMIDDQMSNSFLQLVGNWSQDTSYTAVNGIFSYTKQTGSYARAQWGPKQILLDGYYDIFVNIPYTNLPLTNKCLYLVRDHFQIDSILISQNENEGKFIKVGSFPFRTGDQFAMLISTIPGADTTRYLVADAIKIKKSVEVTSVHQKNMNPNNYVIYQNYPNPFNPNTIINFSIPVESKVYINIYNILGKKVKELLNGKNYRSGSWKINFNAAPYPSGVYFAWIKIKGGKYDVQKTLKMVYIK